MSIPLSGCVRSLVGSAARCAALSISLALVASTSARADEYLDRLNSAQANLPEAKRSDTVLLRALAGLTPPPGVDLESRRVTERLFLLGPGNAAWGQIESWVTAPAQRAALEALAQVTKSNDWRDALVFALPYGVDGVPIDLVRAKLYTDLGDPPTIANARFFYLDRIEILQTLVTLESARLAAEGKIADACDVLVNMAFLGRQLAARKFGAEVEAGLAIIASNMLRVRDILYEDFRGKRSIERARLEAVLDRLNEQRSDLGLERTAFPDGDRVGAEQLVARLIEPRGEVRQDVFAAEMARLGSTERPLRLFAESARWAAAAGQHANWFETTEELAKVYDDWAGRWGVGTFDRRMSLPFRWSSLNRGEYSIIASALKDLGRLYAMRQIARVEVTGTRQALAVLVYTYNNKVFPPTTASTRSELFRAMPADPFNPNIKAGQVPPFEFFVPIRDTRDQFGEREDPKPHVIKVFMPSGVNFDVPLGNDHFIVYSFGPNNAKDWARNVQNTAQRTDIQADYLIWPPTISLYRQHLRDTGQLK